jgi:thymidine kinase
MPCADDSLDKLFGLKTGITGPMASGKTNDFITEINKCKAFAEVNKDTVVVVTKSDKDTRLLFNQQGITDPRTVVQSRDKFMLEGVIPVASSRDLFELYDNLKKAPTKIILGISEMQFLDSGVLDFIESLDSRTYLIWEGLNSSFRGEWYELADYKATMQDVVRLTNNIESHRSVCFYPGCGRFADFTQRFRPDGEPDHWSSELNLVGDKQYSPRCELHHKVPGKEAAKFLIYPLIHAGDKGISKPLLETIGSYAGIPEEEVDLIISAFERENKILIKEGRIFPIYQK